MVACTGDLSKFSVEGNDSVSTIGSISPSSKANLCASFWLYKEHAIPVFPARPVRPMRCK